MESTERALVHHLGVYGGHVGVGCDGSVLYILPLPVDDLHVAPVEGRPVPAGEIGRRCTGQERAAGVSQPQGGAEVREGILRVRE